METSKEFKEAVRTIPPSNYFGQTGCSTTSFPKIIADLQHIIAYMRMQHYAGGGLSAFTGFSAFAASTSKSKYLLGKFDDKIPSYGLQANVADFAYANSRESYLNKSFGQHFGTFVFGGLGGALQGHAMGGKVSELSVTNNKTMLGLRISSSMLAYGIEFAGQSHTKNNYNGFYTKDYKKKLLLSSHKAIFNSILLP